MTATQLEEDGHFIQSLPPSGAITSAIGSYVGVVSIIAVAIGPAAGRPARKL